jgi:hypothetical protein
MRIVIVGLAKTGTTAMFFKLKQAMPRETHCMFEPTTFHNPGGDATHVLAKVLIGRDIPVDFTSFGEFNKKIMIVRDARDTLVSRVLYDIYNDAAFCREDARVDALVDILRRKEADPLSVPLRDIIELFDRMSSRRLLARATDAAARAFDFQRRYPNCFRYRYEDLVRAHWEPVESYLEFALSPGPASVAPEYERVTRTKASGDWRNWLTPSDVEFFRPYFVAFEEHNGYSNDWTLPDRPHILPEHASDYVLRLVDERRRIG